MTSNSLNDRKYTGGLHGARGYEFEKSFILSQLPDWLAHNDLSFFQQELWSDLELFFESGARWIVQIKNHMLELTEFREVMRDFNSRHHNGNGCYAKFIVVSTGLANSVREIKNMLERWTAVEHLDESELAATRADSADKFREHGLGELEQFLFGAAGKIEIRDDLSWIGDENNVQQIFSSKLIAKYKLDPQTAESLYLRTSRRLSTERGVRIDLGPFREELRSAEADQSHLTRAIPFILPQLDISTFTGRTEELSRLEELILKPKGEKVCSIVGLSGSGGIGKSALACHFAELHKDVFPAGVIGLRVDGKSNDAIAREFARLCGEEIPIEDERDATTIMQEVFAHRRMLLIFDNAEEGAIHSLRPGGATCAVIITTRDRQLPSLIGIPEAGRIDLPPLHYDESLSLLKELIGRDRVIVELKWIDEVMRLVGYLPLALQIVGATLQLQQGRSIESYATSLKEERERLQKLRIRGALHLDVRASFALSLRLLEMEEIDFFASLSVCAQEGFSIESAMAAGGCDKSKAHEWLGYLYRLSLLNC